MVTIKMRNERARRKSRLQNTKPKKRGALFAASAPVQEKKCLQENTGEASNAMTENDVKDDEEKLDSEAMHSGIHVTEILAEMKKEIEDPCILQTVLQKTFADRRTFVLDAKSAKEIWKMWPAMKTSQAVCIDHQLLESFDRACVQEQYKKLVQVLLKFFNKDDDFPRENESIQAEMFSKLEVQLHPKVSKLQPKAITSLKVGETTPDKLLSNAPIAVLYCQKKKIANAFILAENETVFAVKKTTMFTVLESLIATYYAYNIKFPPAYSHFFSYIEYCLYGKQIINTTKALTQLKVQFDNFAE